MNLGGRPAELGQSRGDFPPLALDDVHELFRGSGVDDRLPMRIDGLQIINSVFDFLGLCPEIARLARDQFAVGGVV